MDGDGSLNQIMELFWKPIAETKRLISDSKISIMEGGAVNVHEQTMGRPKSHFGLFKIF